MFIFEGDYGGSLTRITESADRETFWITVEDASRLEVGQRIHLIIKSTEAINEFLAPYQPKPEWTRILNNGIQLEEKHSIAEIRGNRVRLNEPLHTNINHEHDWRVNYLQYLEEVGVEGHQLSRYVVREICPSQKFHPRLGVGVCSNSSYVSIPGFDASPLSTAMGH